MATLNLTKTPIGVPQELQSAFSDVYNALWTLHASQASASANAPALVQGTGISIRVEGNTYVISNSGVSRVIPVGAGYELLAPTSDSGVYNLITLLAGENIQMSLDKEKGLTVSANLEKVYWDSIVDAPATYPPSVHSHALFDVVLYRRGSSSFKTISDYFDLTYSSSLLAGGQITLNVDCTISVAAGSCLIRETADNSGHLYVYDFTATNLAAIAAGVTKQVVLVQALTTNGDGTVSRDVTVQLADIANNSNILSLATVTNINGKLHFLAVNPSSAGLLNTIITKDKAVSPVAIEASSGFKLTTGVSRTLQVEAGALWASMNRYTHTYRDTAVKAITEVYGSHFGLTLSSWPNANYYNTSTDSLTAITAGKYGCLWIFSSIDTDDWFVAYGTAQFDNATAAAASQVPSYLAAQFTNSSFLLGRLIFLAGADNPFDLETASNFKVTGTTAKFADLVNSYASLVNGKVPESQLPSYVDDVVEYDNFAAFPVTGERGKIYIDCEKDATYRWTGTTYAKIGDGSSQTIANTDALAEGTVNKYYTDARARAALSASGDLAYNPTTGAFSYTAPAKEPPITAGTSAQYWRGDKTWQTLNKAAVGLNNVDNTADIDKAVKSATVAATVLGSASGTGPIINIPYRSGSYNTVQQGAIGDFGGNHFELGIAMPQSGLHWPFGICKAGSRIFAVDPTGKLVSLGGLSVAGDIISSTFNARFTIGTSDGGATLGRYTSSAGWTASALWATNVPNGYGTADSTTYTLLFGSGDTVLNAPVGACRFKVGNVECAAMTSKGLDVTGSISSYSHGAYGDQNLQTSTLLGFSLNRTGSDQYYKIATLPATSTASRDHLVISGVFDDNWSSGQKAKFEIVMGNRDVFSYRWHLFGIGHAGSAIRAYKEADGTISVWAATLGTYLSTLNINILHAVGCTIYRDGIAGTPTGTLVFDSTDTTTYPPQFWVGIDSSTLKSYGKDILHSGNFNSYSPTLTGGGASGTWNITSLGVSKSVSGTNSATLVSAGMADNDFFRILVGGTASSAGYAEIATADDGTEPIYVRQYTGVFANAVRTLALLDEGGNTVVPGYLHIGNDWAAQERQIHFRNATRDVYFYLNSAGTSAGLWDNTGGHLLYGTDIAGNFSSYGGITSGGSLIANGNIQSNKSAANLTIGIGIGGAILGRYTSAAGWACSALWPTNVQNGYGTADSTTYTLLFGNGDTILNAPGGAAAACRFKLANVEYANVSKAGLSVNGGISATGKVSLPYLAVNGSQTLQIGATSDFGGNFELGIALPSGGTHWPFGIHKAGSSLLTVDDKGNVIAASKVTSAQVSTGNCYASTSAGGPIYTGTKVGSSYADETAVFRAILDNPNGSASYLFEGFCGGSSGTRTHYVRADGLAYFANNISTDGNLYAQGSVALTAATFGNYAVSAQQAWQSLTLASNMTSYSAGTTPGYMKDSFGFVHLRGAVVCSYAASYSNLQLPIGYRPPTGRVITLLGAGSDGKTYTGFIGDTGSFTNSNPSGTTCTYTFDSICFRAA